MIAAALRRGATNAIFIVVCVSNARAAAGAEPVTFDRRFHDELIVVDGHVHMISPVFHTGVDPWKVQSNGTFDYARARQGGLDVVFETLNVGDGYNRYNYTIKQTLRLIETFYRVLESNGDKMALARDSQEVRQIVADGKLAVVLALEGGMDMEGDLDVLRSYHRLGVRMIQLTTHNSTNALVDSAYDKRRWNGISRRGREVIDEMNRLGIIVDISHASDEAKSQIIAASRAPVVSSHNGLRRFSSATGTLTDEHVRDLTGRGGLIGLHSAGWFLSQAALGWGFDRPRYAPRPAHTVREPSALTRDPLDYGDYIDQLDDIMVDHWLVSYGYGEPWRERQWKVEQAGAPLATVEDWAAQASYLVGVAGSQHVGLGLDLLAGGNWLKDFDATAYPRVAEALRAQGLSTETIANIMGENWLRLLDAAEAPE